MEAVLAAVSTLAAPYNQSSLFEPPSVTIPNLLGSVTKPHQGTRSCNPIESQVHARLEKLAPIDDSAQLEPPLDAAKQLTDSERLVDTSCRLLLCLTESMAKTEHLRVEQDGRVDTISKLSLVARKELGALLRLIISIAIIPFLAKGLSRPNSGRAGPFTKLQEDIRQESKELFAYQVTKTMHSMCGEPELLSIVAENLLEFIGALLQLGYSPVASESTRAPTNDTQTAREWAQEVVLTFQDKVAISPTNFGRAIMVLLSISQTVDAESRKTGNAPQYEWAREICGSLLTSIVLRNQMDGVGAIMELLLDAPQVQEATYMQTARLIAAIPKAMTIETYYDIIVPQLLKYLFDSREKHSKVAKITLDGLILRSVPAFLRAAGPELFAPLIAVNVIMTPTFLVSQFAARLPKQVLALIQHYISAFDCERLQLESYNPGQITRSLQLVDLLCSDVISLRLAELFLPLIPGIFEYLVAARNEPSLSDTYQSAQHAIRSILVLTEVDVSVSMLRLLVSASAHYQKTKTLPNAYVEIDPSTKRLCVKARRERGGTTPSEEHEFLVDTFATVGAVDDVLKAIRSDGGSKHNPLGDTTKKRNSSEADIVSLFFTSLLSDILSESEAIGVATDVLGTVATQLLLKMTESSPEHLLQSPRQVCLFSQMLLKSGDVETASLSMAILDVVIKHGSALSASERAILLPDLLPYLKLFTVCDNPSVSDQAKHLLSATTSLLEMSPKQQREEEEMLFERQQQQGAASEEERWSECLKDISSPIIPIRAGGMIELRKLVLLNRPGTEAKLATALAAFNESLNHDDTYVYLAAIQGISSIGDIAIEVVFPLLATVYTDPKKPAEMRLKLGESILQISQRLGEMLPKYSQRIFNILVSVLKDKDPTIRASALTNIAEMCGMMKQGLRSILEEVVAAIIDVSVVEREPEVRRAAADLVYRMLSGLDQSVFQVVPKPQMVKLKQVMQVFSLDSDEPTKFLAELSTQLLEDIVREKLSSSALTGDTFVNSLRFVK